MVLGKSSVEKHTQMTDTLSVTKGGRTSTIVLGVTVALLMLGAPAFADGNCGPLAGGGTRGCPPAPNPTPLTLAFTMPGRDDVVAVTVTLTRGVQQDRSGPPGAPPQ